MSSGNPFAIGFRAARANLVPGLIIQAVMIALVFAYYFFPPALSWFQLLANAKSRWGYAFSFTSAIIAGAVLPILFQIAIVQRGRVKLANLQDLLFLAVFWGVEGVVVDGLYRLQAGIFGPYPNFSTVAKKVLVDQFIYNPLYAAPFTVACYELKHHGYCWRNIAHVFTTDFYRNHTIPALCATWVVWIPVTSAVYSLPSLLQIPLFALALTFWVLMLAYITSRHHASDLSHTPFPLPVTD